MPSSYTTSLRLTLPATGELAGQWGNTVNTGITELLDAAVAGTASISTWGGPGIAYTLSNNSGTADEARRMFIVATGAPGEAKNVVCPAVSKFYVLRNDTTGGFALTLKTPAGSGIAVPAGQYKFLYCNGTDVVEMFNSAGALTLSGALSVGGTTTLASNPTLSAGTANQVQFLNASKVLTGSTNLTFDGTSLTLGGNPTLSAGTANGVVYLNASKVATSGANLTYDGTSLGLDAGGGTGPAYLNVSQRSRFGYDGTNVLISDAGTGKDIVFTRITEQMRLTSTGLGIGTSSPAVRLQILDGGANSTGTMRLGGATYYGTIQHDPVSTGANIYDVTSASGGGHIFRRGGSNLMSLDSSGNLGLGVTPSAWNASFKALQVSNSCLCNNGAADTFLGANFYNDTGGTNRYTTSAHAAAYGQVDGAHQWYTAPSGTAGTAISFTQSMTLDASGNLLVGTTSQLLSALFSSVAGASANGGAFQTTASAGNYTAIAGARNGNDGRVAEWWWNTSTLVGSISVTSSATAYNTSSDYRLKDNQQPLTGSGAFIDALKPKTWNWKADGSKGVGFIAHEVQEVSPASVTGTKDAVDEEGKPVYQAMEYGSAEFIANIIAELQSLRARVAALEAQP